MISCHVLSCLTLVTIFSSYARLTAEGVACNVMTGLLLALLGAIISVKSRFANWTFNNSRIPIYTRWLHSIYIYCLCSKQISLPFHTKFWLDFAWSIRLNQSNQCRINHLSIVPVERLTLIAQNSQIAGRASSVALSSHRIAILVSILTVTLPRAVL